MLFLSSSRSRKGYMSSKGAVSRRLSGTETGLKCLGLIEGHVGEEGAVGGKGLADQGGEVFLVDFDRGDAVGGGDFEHIGGGNAAGGAAAGLFAEEVGLGGADGEVAAIGEDEDFDGEAVVDDGLEFL